MNEPWQTQINLYLPFPWRCANMKIEDSTELRQFYGCDETHDVHDQEDELAFWCVFSHRILISECQGFSCPSCKLIGHDEFIKRIGGCQ